jgi:hypothetical protein
MSNKGAAVALEGPFGVELAEAEVAVGDERAHADLGGPRF